MKLLTIILLLAFSTSGYSQKKTYEYDDLNRLSKAHYWEGSSIKVTVTYTFDEVGNRLSKTVTLNCPTTNVISELVNAGVVLNQASGTVILQNTSYTGTASGQIGANNSVTILPNTLIDKGTTFIINTDGCQN